jgi:hypothetical protein
MSEQEFWNVIEAMSFNTKGYKEAGRYLIEDSGLTIDQMTQVESMARSKVNELYNRLWDVRGVSDDSYSDLIWQIVANGQPAFEKATVQSAQEMIDNGQYTESFSYAFHDLWDLQK